MVLTYLIGQVHGCVDADVSDGEGEESGKVGGVDGGDDQTEEPPGGRHDARRDGVRAGEAWDDNLNLILFHIVVGSPIMLSKSSVWDL